MSLVRFSSAAAACVVLGAAGAACSGSFGSGSTMPTTMASPNFGATPSPSPSAASSILTIGESSAFQALPQIGGYSGQIAFPTVAPDEHTPPPKGTPLPSPTPVSIAIGATLSVAKPADGPDVNLETSGHKKHTREHPARALAYIELLPTHDVTLPSYPRISFDIPREIASEYRDGEFGIALWNSGEKDSIYRLAVAEPDAKSTVPPAVTYANPSATGTAVTPLPNGATRVAGAPPGMGGNVPLAGGAVSPPPAGTIPSMSPLAGQPGGVTAPAGVPGSVSPHPTASPTLPPQRIVFTGQATPLKLLANRPLIFALYALPHPKETPTPAVSGSGAPGPAPSSGTAQPAATPGAAASSAPGSPAPAASAAGTKAAPGR
jgi:hypothetical protein